MRLSLLEDICDCASSLIAVHPSLHFFAQDVSSQDLIEWTSVVHSDSSAGKPVSSPTEFVSEVKRVVSRQAWAQLARLLEKWNDLSSSKGESRLSVQEHEHLTMGVLWETSLITECNCRHNALQKEILAINTADSLTQRRRLKLLN